MPSKSADDPIAVVNRQNPTTRRRADRLVRTGRAAWIGPDSIKIEDQQVHFHRMKHGPSLSSLVLRLREVEGAVLPVSPEWLFRMGYPVFGVRLNTA